jgi:hypothetical protein
MITSQVSVNCGCGHKYTVNATLPGQPCVSCPKCKAVHNIMHDGNCIHSSMPKNDPIRKNRFTRQSTGKPKTDTYGGKAAIVDGCDGRTYLLQFAGMGDFIKVSRSDFMDASMEMGGKAAVFPKDERFAELAGLIAAANP